MVVPTIRRESSKSPIDIIKVMCNDIEIEAAGVHKKFCPRVDPNRYPGATMQGVPDYANKCMYYFKSVYKKHCNPNPLCPDRKQKTKRYFWHEIPGSVSKLERPDLVLSEVISSTDDIDPYNYNETLLPLDAVSAEERIIRESFSKLADVCNYRPYEDAKDKSLVSFMIQLRPKKNTCPPTQVEICTNGSYQNFYFVKTKTSRGKKSTRVNFLYSRKREEKCYNDYYIHN